MTCFNCGGFVDVKDVDGPTCIICGRQQYAPRVNFRPFVVGRTDGAPLPGVSNRTRTFQFVEEAVRFVGSTIRERDEAGVSRGDYYIDAAP